MAVICVCYGCTSEPALLLSTVDWLLDEMRTFLGCSSSIYDITATMGALRVKKNTQERKGPEFRIVCRELPDPSALRQQHRKYILIAELGLFVRGCVLTAITSTLCRYHGLGESTYQAMWIDLLAFNKTCAGCETEVKFFEDSSGQRYSISIGVKDSRIGYAEVRSIISENRRDIYMCLISMSRLKLWAPNMSPVFLYYAELYHPPCKTARSKDVLFT